MRKLKYREVRELAQDHAVVKQRRWGSHPGSPAPRSECSRGLSTGVMWPVVTRALLWRTNGSQAVPVAQVRNRGMTLSVAERREERRWS